jgi:hypothetical protein
MRLRPAVLDLWLGDIALPETLHFLARFRQVIQFACSLALGLLEYVIDSWCRSNRVDGG